MKLKGLLRKKILSERRNFNEGKHYIANDEIINKVKDLIKLSHTKKVDCLVKKPKLIIGLYWPIKGEPDLLKLAVDSKYTIALPKIRGDRMDYVKYEIGAELEISTFNKLKQPVNNTKIVPNIVILPALGFSLAGNRLGFGMGQYDKYFAHLENDIIKIGVCFHENLYEHLPHEPHDIKMDYVITDKTFILCNKKMNQP